MAEERIEDTRLETLIDIAYEVAPYLYFKADWRNTVYSRDEFIQDAAIYIFDKYNQGYFDNKTDEQLRPMVIGMLSGYFLKNQNKTAKKYYARTPRVNEQDTDEESSLGLRSYVFSDKKTLSPSDDYELQTIIDDILDLFSDEPYKTRKHTYSAKIGRKTVLANDKIIAALLLSGYTIRDIVELFVDIPAGVYYSHDARASYLGNSKILTVLKRINDYINLLDNREKELIKSHILSLGDKISYLKKLLNF